MDSIEAARTLCRSHINRLMQCASEPPRPDDLHHEKLASFAALSGAARFARMIEAYEAGELLDKIADGLIEDAMHDDAAVHLEALKRDAE